MKVFISFAMLVFSLLTGYSQAWKADLDTANIFRDQKKTGLAIKYYARAKEALTPDSTYSSTYIRLEKSLAELYYSSGSSEMAAMVCHELIRIIAKINTEMNADYAWTCNMLGAIYNTSGRLDSARILHLKAREIREKLFGNKDKAYAQSCNNLGALYHDLGQFEMAEPLFIEAKAIRENIEPLKKAPAYAITLVALANLYRDMGQYNKAEQLYLEAKDIRSSGGKYSAAYAASCNILADLYFYMHRYDKAEALYLEAKDIRQTLDSGSYEYGQTLNNLAHLYKDLKQYEKAGIMALEAKQVYENKLTAEHSSRIINLNTLGEFYYATGKYKESESYFLQARQLWETRLGRDHPYFIANTEELARLYRNINKPEKAAKLFSEASRLKYEQLNQVFGFTNETEKQLYVKNITGSGDEYYSLNYRGISHKNAAESFALSLRNRNLILSSVQQLRLSIHTSGDTGLIVRYKEWTGLKEQLAKLYSLGAAAKTDAISGIEDKADDIEKELSRKSAVFKKTQRKISWQDIQHNLKHNEAAIEFVEFRLTDNDNRTDSTLYIALLLRKNVAPVLIPLFEKKQLDDLISHTGSMEDINRIYSSPVLFNLVWSPLENYLTGINCVYFASAGSLFRISFSAIWMSPGKVLSDKYSLVQLNTTAAVTDQSPDFINRKDSIRLYGGIYYDADSMALKAAVLFYYDTAITSQEKNIDLDRGRSFKYLPGTKEEVDSIKKQAERIGTKALVFSGINASEESLQILNRRASPAVLHFATHGFFFPDPATDERDSVQKKFETGGNIFRQSSNPMMRAGLLFAGGNHSWRGKPITGINDGILTAYEISNGLYLPSTKLVVLSACETALGDIEGSEGVYGLQRAFKMAGVKNLVMSLWKVPDAETSAFMKEFYYQMFNRLPVSNAFYKARQVMKERYRSEPYKWAAWILVR